MMVPPEVRLPCVCGRPSGLHHHYRDWIRMPEGIEPCECRQHPRLISAAIAFAAWAGRYR